jgi:hypothetical protein
MQSSLRKMATNGKGKGKIENVYLAISGFFFNRLSAIMISGFMNEHTD